MLSNAFSINKIQEHVKKILSIDPKFPLWFYLLVFYICSLFVTGFRIYLSNNSFQIPLVHILNDPTLFPNDPLVATLPYYASMLWRFVAFGARFFPIEKLLVTLFLLERLLVIYAAGRLARTFMPGSKLAAIGAMAMFALAPKPILGNGIIVESMFEQTGLAIAFLMLAFSSFYRSHFISSAIWLALGFTVNSMYGTYALTYLIPVFLMDRSYWSKWKKWVPAGVLFLTISAPTIILTVSAFGVSSSDTNLWVLASQIRFPHHLYPLDWRMSKFIKFALLAFLIIALLYQYRKTSKQLFRHGMIWTTVSIGWLFYAFLAAYAFKWPSMLVMHPARATDLWYCVGGITLISLFAKKITEDESKSRFLLVPFLASIFLWLTIEANVVLLLFLGLIALTWNPLWKYFFLEGSQNRLALIVTVLITMLAGTSTMKRLKSDGNAFMISTDKHIREIAEWARDSTNLRTTFLINPYWDEFRGLSKRSAFVKWRDGSAILWYRSYVTEWASRLKAIGFDITKAKVTGWLDQSKLNNCYAELNDEKVQKLQEQYSIDYWVVALEHTSSFPIAFENHFYKVLLLTDIGADH